jgi:hypothetical protein
MRTKAGAEELLRIEDGHPWNELPVSFWDDYMECATLTPMPEHVLRAADHVEKLHAPPSAWRELLEKIARQRIDPFDPKKDYPPRQVWVGENAGENVVFTSTICGVRFEVPSGWQVERMEVSKSSCVAYFSTGPYQATVRRLYPSVMLMVKQPEKNETLQTFSRRFMTKGTFEPVDAPRCPADTCISIKGVQPGTYKGDGDGYAYLVFFERNQPEYPGLVFEAPVDITKPDQEGKTQVFHPTQEQERIPGKLYYMVLLDTAASIEGPAMKDYAFFLEHLTVE